MEEPTAKNAVHLEILFDESARRDAMRVELLESLSRPLKEIPPKYFYDEAGSLLFERITSLPEYYLTRTETVMLEALAGPLTRKIRPEELFELGSGYSVKTKLLLDGMRAAGCLRRYRPFDVNEQAVREAAGRLVREYPGLQVWGLIGDFTRHLPLVDRGERRLLALLGSTIGNLPRPEATHFLTQLAATMGPEDHFLLGTDLVKDADLLEAAYNDAAGVTAEFNRNVLQVLNRELGANFDREGFAHLAFYDRRAAWIEMRLRSLRPQTVRIPDLDLTLTIEEGEEIRTEISCKYTREAVEELLSRAGLRLLEWHTDPEGLFALSLSRLG